MAVTNWIVHFLHHETWQERAAEVEFARAIRITSDGSCSCPPRLLPGGYFAPR